MGGNSVSTKENNGLRTGNKNNGVRTKVSDNGVRTKVNNGVRLKIKTMV